MSRISPLASITFNSLAPQVRTLMSQRGCTATLNTYFDGSATVDLVVFAGNTSVTHSIVISTKLDEKNQIIGYRIADSERMKECANLGECVAFMRSLVHKTKTILSRV